MKVKKKSAAHKLLKLSQQYLIGGVNSPARSFVGVSHVPVFVKKAKGAYLWDIENKKYIDFCLSWGGLIAGHAPDFLTARVKTAITAGTSFGLTSPLEIELARQICAAMPALEKIRFTNSGTEAVMTALRLARAFTKREKIVRFAGSYHGHGDALLGCAGVPRAVQDATLTLGYNDWEGVENAIAQHGKNIAAVIVEPVAANMGVVLPHPDFLQRLRTVTSPYGILLIFDEVVTGFRIGYHGAQHMFSLKPDLTCLGKIIGGGFPVGAVGGKKEIMELLSPVGNVFEAGTFSGNPVTMQAGLSTLRFLRGSNYYGKLEHTTRRLCQDIQTTARDFRIPLHINQIGSMFTLFFTEKKVMDFPTAQTHNRAAFIKLYAGLLEHGILFSPSPLEAQFLSIAHTQEDCAKTVAAFGRIFKNW